MHDMKKITSAIILIPMIDNMCLRGLNTRKPHGHCQKNWDQINSTQ